MGLLSRCANSQSLNLRPIRTFRPVSKLDFSHLRVERVGYARHRTPLKEVIDAHPTDRNDTGFGTVCATVLRARLRARSGASGRRDPYPGQAYRELRLACGR